MSLPRATGPLAEKGVLNPFLSRGINFSTVEFGTLLFVAQYGEGRRYLFEALFRDLVIGIDVRVQFLDQTLVGAANFGI